MTSAQLPRPLRLVVGLGNPGRQYEHTRHNAGFWWVKSLAQELGVSLAFEKRFESEIGLARIADGPLRLLCPLTYMNRSGQAVAAVARYFGIAADEILVVHDELDLSPGTVRLKFNGGHAGHNGLRDIDEQLASRNYWRLRIGIGHPRRSATPEKPPADYVLEPPSAPERAAIEAAIKRSLAERERLLAGAFAAAMQVLHGS
ncbi:MAG: aminoacyl-tRNA hydrolase [Casimicrobiaceae bacterium]|nr:aminoacyl-tRNA hydrolase [Casimicrobiaceae bacterium]MCX8097421.1 aminoacyl-tRNA hydrolase [Casimicrobiaceae bacterium]MDW8312055.1 aminoacyl-tRNA hydrolase [Burkholderiales bacterium]